MRAATPKHLCATCRPLWIAWRNADDDPAWHRGEWGTGCTPGAPADLNPTTGRNRRRENTEAFIAEQMAGIARRCGQGDHRTPVAAGATSEPEPWREAILRKANDLWDELLAVVEADSQHDVQLIIPGFDREVERAALRSYQR